MRLNKILAFVLAFLMIGIPLSVLLPTTVSATSSSTNYSPTLDGYIQKSNTFGIIVDATGPQNQVGALNTTFPIPGHWLQARTYYNFTITGLSGKTIDSAVLHVYTEGTGNAETIQMYAGTLSSTLTASDWGCGSTYAGQTVKSSWAGMINTTISPSVIQTTGPTCFEVKCSDETSIGNRGGNTYSIEESVTGYRPYLTVTYHTAATIIYHDDFESGIGKWDDYYPSAAFVSTDQAYTGSYSLRLTSVAASESHTLVSAHSFPLQMGVSFFIDVLPDGQEFRLIGFSSTDLPVGPTLSVYRSGSVYELYAKWYASGWQLADVMPVSIHAWHTVYMNATSATSYKLFVDGVKQGTTWTGGSGGSSADVSVLTCGYMAGDGQNIYLDDYTLETGGTDPSVVTWKPTFTSIPPTDGNTSAAYVYTASTNESSTFTLVSGPSWAHLSGDTITGYPLIAGIAPFNLSATSVAGSDIAYQTWSANISAGLKNATIGWYGYGTNAWVSPTDGENGMGFFVMHNAGGNVSVWNTSTGELMQTDIASVTFLAGSLQQFLGLDSRHFIAIAGNYIVVYELDTSHQFNQVAVTTLPETIGGHANIFRMTNHDVAYYWTKYTDEYPRISVLHWDGLGNLTMQTNYVSNSSVASGYGAFSGPTRINGNLTWWWLFPEGNSLNGSLLYALTPNHIPILCAWVGGGIVNVEHMLNVFSPNENTLTMSNVTITRVYTVDPTNNNLMVYRGTTTIIIASLPTQLIARFGSYCFANAVDMTTIHIYGISYTNPTQLTQIMPTMTPPYYASFGIMNIHTWLAVFTAHAGLVTISFYYILQPISGFDFTGTPTSGYTALTVHFHYLPHGTVLQQPTNITWDVNGDGISEGYGLDFTYTYTVPGTYTVTCVASNMNNTMTVTKVGYIHVTDRWMDTIMQNNIMAIIWLMVLFLPALVLDIKFGKFGWILGMVIMLTALGFSQSGFMFITVIGYAGIVIMFIKGR